MMTRQSLVAIALTCCLTTAATAQTPTKLDRKAAIQTDPTLSQVGKALRLGDYDRAIKQFQQAKAKTKDKCTNRGYTLSIAAAQATKKKFSERKTTKQQEQAFRFYTQEFERLTIQDPVCGIPSLRAADTSRRATNPKFSLTIHPVFQSLLSTLYQRTKIPVRLPTYIPGLNAEKLLSSESTIAASSANNPYLTNLKAEKPLLATLASATANEYTIVLGNRPNCQGQNSCKRGSLSATKLTPQAISLDKTFQQAANFVNNPLFNKEGRRSSDEMGPVTLSNNLKGYFIPWVLSDHYTEAKIIWEQDGVRYSVGIQQGDKDSLIKMANSAIKPPLAPWLDESP
jgi:hypothetical protein